MLLSQLSFFPIHMHQLGIQCLAQEHCGQQKLGIKPPALHSMDMPPYQLRRPYIMWRGADISGVNQSYDFISTIGCFKYKLVFIVGQLQL